MGKNKKITSSRKKSQKNIRKGIIEGNTLYNRLEKEGKLVHTFIRGN